MRADAGESIGEDPQRDGLLHTPERFERAFRYLTSGYQQDPEKIPERRGVRRLLRRDGGGQGHRAVQPVRASPAAFFRQDATWPIFRTKKSSACRKSRAW